MDANNAELAWVGCADPWCNPSNVEEANAKLVASAPELLAERDELRRKVAETIRLLDGAPGERDVALECLKARKVLVGEGDPAE